LLPAPTPSATETLLLGLSTRREHLGTISNPSCCSDFSSSTAFRDAPFLAHTAAHIKHFVFVYMVAFLAQQ